MPFGFLKRRTPESGEKRGALWSPGHEPAPVGRWGTTSVEFDVTQFGRIRDDAAVQVVGEAYRQEMVAKARAPGLNELPPGLNAPPAGYYKALLVPEPTNRYDPNAIIVALWSGRDWSKCGYLARGEAGRYRPVFAYLARGGKSPAIACDAAIVAEAGGRGVILHLGTPGECMAELTTDDREPAEHEWRGLQIAFTGSSRTAVHGVLLDREGQLMFAEWAGCVVQARVTKKVNLLVAAEPRDVTTNTQKAKDYGIPIVEEIAFLRAIGVPSEALAVDTLAWAR